jgi:hypothetical protein
MSRQPIRTRTGSSPQSHQDQDVLIPPSPPRGTSGRQWHGRWTHRGSGRCHLSYESYESYALWGMGSAGADVRSPVGGPLISIRSNVVVALSLLEWLILRYATRPYGASWRAFRGEDYPTSATVQKPFLAFLEPPHHHARRASVAAPQRLWPFHSRGRGRQVTGVGQ